MTATATHSSRLTVQAPAGSHFEFREVKTAHGQTSLGQVPILVWDSLDGALAHYGEESILGVLDGTSLLVSYQGTARRMRAAKKSDDEIAKAQVDFRPGTREVGVSTPKSRARNSAAKAAEALGGEGGDTIAMFLDRITAGDITKEELAALLGSK
jgi:hypothetical protein